MKHFDPIKYILENTTIDDLISWLETKPKNGTYNYGDPDHCLLCQFLKDHGVMLPNVSSSFWGTRPMLPFDDGRRVNLPPHFDDIAANRGCSCNGEFYFSCCYGAALACAREYVKK